MRISDLPEVMLIQPCLKAEKAFHCTKNSIHVFDVLVQCQPSFLLHSEATHHEQRTRLLRALNIGEVCDTSGEVRAGKARTNALTACLVEAHCHSVNLGQCRIVEIVLEGIKCIHNDAMLNGMHDVDDSTHEDAMRIASHLNAIKGVVHPVD